MRRRCGEACGCAGAGERGRRAEQRRDTDCAIHCIPLGARVRLLAGRVQRLRIALVGADLSDPRRRILADVAGAQSGKTAVGARVPTGVDASGDGALMRLRTGR